ncbi:membrane bound O-acyl transferase family-domain-containing protein [Fusarium flagelliforme]|uniref:membrane bound O-acyl transferase family-domain-containing protein n=1 Tax=Fusarium flagelliforme TaxID=2675880 RepID=UPI001E8CC78F|nr:membrane bound O-acyl transferase family-domain-containing protein [Fusarium flagelliforme]KAH7198439.1 membrane bound O-acyl transferase family-domain-containing protein [Fusarium flagelliforme]
MTVQSALNLAATSQALTAFGLGYTRPSNLARWAIALSVAWLTWLFNQAIHDALQSRLHVALLSTGMWIQCLKTFDDLCLTKLSFDEETKKSSSTSSSRLHFGVSNLWNMRGVGTSKVISQIPCWSHSPGRLSSVPSRGQEMLRHIRNATISYLVLDVFACQPPPDLENMMSPRNELLLSRLREIGAGEAIFRFFAVFGFWLNTFCVIHLVNSIFCLSYLILGLYPVEMLPPIWGQLSEAYTIRRFWGNFWHQTLRRHLTSISDFLVHRILHMLRGSLVARYCKLFISFFISGALHYPADRALGISVQESNAIPYFVITAFAIMCEDSVQHISKGWGSKRRRYLGYFWVALYMYWMTPSWGYPAARVVRPQDQLVSYSVIRQLKS